MCGEQCTRKIQRSLCANEIIFTIRRRDIDARDIQQRVSIRDLQMRPPALGLHFLHRRREQRVDFPRRGVVGLVLEYRRLGVEHVPEHRNMDVIHPECAQQLLRSRTQLYPASIVAESTADGCLGSQGTRFGPDISRRTGEQVSLSSVFERESDVPHSGVVCLELDMSAGFFVLGVGFRCDGYSGRELLHDGDAVLLPQQMIERQRAVGFGQLPPAPGPSLFETRDRLASIPLEFLVVVERHDMQVPPEQTRVVERLHALLQAVQSLQRAKPRRVREARQVDNALKGLYLCLRPE
ncbi:hypothetical protein C8F01DRAFT_1155887 [Mycena amicta]|nr:hypothetical protein C8F01DRAFT_1155887 [Mycena amicta]